MGGGSRAVLTEATAVTHSAVPEVNDSNNAPVLPVSALASSGTGTDAPADASAPIFVPPQFRVRTEPAYPERARRAGAEGVVGVRIVLAANGSVRQVELTQSSGSRLLDEAALTAARASSFAPASRNRAPVDSEAVATYRFELR